MSAAGPAWSAGRDERAIVATIARRSFIVSGPVVGLLCAWAATHRTRPAVDVLVVLLACFCARYPDSHLGLPVIALVVTGWLSTVHDVATPWSVGVAAALAMFHASMAAATVAPPWAAWTRAMTRRWVRRTLVVAATAGVTWTMVAVTHDHRVPGGAALLAAALAALAVAALWVRNGTPRDPDAVHRRPAR